MRFDINCIIERIQYDPNSVKKSYDGKTDIYYAKVSYRCAYLKRVLCLILMLSAILLLLSGSLSYNKLYYLALDVKLAAEYVSSVHDTISYNVGNSQSFALYRGGLAVASRERLELFSASGKELYSSNHSYGNPVLTSSDKYILLCDVGGKQFSLYNSFSKLRDGVLDVPIYGAALADNGTFALISSNEDLGSAVSVYGVDGAKYDYSFSSGRVSALALSTDGNRMAVILTHARGNRLVGEVRTYRIGKLDYESAELGFDGLPYALRIFDNGNICAVGGRGACVFSEKLKLLGEYLPEKEIYLCSFGEDNIAVGHSSADGALVQLAVINKYGRVEKELRSNERVLGIDIYGSYLFLTKLGFIERINLVFGDSKKIELTFDGFKLLACDPNTVLAANSSYAKFISFK